MTKEEYKKSLSDLRVKISTVNEEIIKLNQSYIDSNKQFNIGDRIKITSNRNGGIRYAYVCNNKISYSDDIKIEAYKEKKDGTTSMLKDFIWTGDKVELA